MKKYSKAQSQALAFHNACKNAGFTWAVSGSSVVRVMQNFTPGDTNAFVACDMAYGDLLALVPLKGGSIWGTDGGSIGGHVAIKNGQFTMNKSGTGTRFTDALRNWKTWN